MILFDQFWNMLCDFLNNLMSLGVGFFEDVLEVIEKFLSDVLMVFHMLPILILEDCDSIVHLMLDCGVVKEFCVPFSFLEPENP